MIKSMTGFGRCELANEERRITVELKTVNHRYLDINIRMPKKLNCFETAIRSLLKGYVERGKVDVFIACEDFAGDRGALRYNAQLAAEYVELVRKMAEQFGMENDLTPVRLSRYPEVLTMGEQVMDEQQLWGMMEETVGGACRQLADARVAEGRNLTEDLTEKLNELQLLVAKIEERSPQLWKEYRDRLADKVAELLGDVQMDEARLATEVTIFADRICTDEEIVRLKSHISGMKDALSAEGSVGRKLDFIAQEMNREANTILSKSNDLTVTGIGIELKTEIEKLREQIQNIE